MRLLSVLAFAGLGVAGMGGWYGFSVLRPKNLQQYLEWQGFKLVSDSDVNTWTSILDGNKELVSKVVKEVGVTTKDLNDWCKSVLPLEHYEEQREAASILCVNRPKTVKEAIIQQKGGTGHLISNDDQLYKVAYVFRRHIPKILELINFEPPTSIKKSEDENLDGGAKSLKEWCESSLKDKPTEELVSNVNILCSPRSHIRLYKS